MSKPANQESEKISVLLKENEALNQLPRHIAVIMDGNGRWAKAHKLPRSMGHREGTKATKRLVRSCGELGIEYLTIYVFSSENWRRPKLEITALMRLLIEKIKSEVNELNRENVRLMATGNLSQLPEKTRRELEWGMEKTSQNTGLKLILALSYGGRQEIVDACKTISGEVASGKLALDSINEEMFSNYLYCPDVPDPELLIRTGGDMRISNFLLWEVAYTEIYVTPVLWPDFNREELEKAIFYYLKTQRNFGGIKES